MFLPFFFNYKSFIYWCLCIYISFVLTTRSFEQRVLCENFGRSQGSTTINKIRRVSHDVDQTKKLFPIGVSRTGVGILHNVRCWLSKKMRAVQVKVQEIRAASEWAVSGLLSLAPSLQADRHTDKHRSRTSEYDVTHSSRSCDLAHTGDPRYDRVRTQSLLLFRFFLFQKSSSFFLSFFL